MGGDCVVFDLTTGIRKHGVRLLEGCDGMSDTMPGIMVS